MRRAFYQSPAARGAAFTLLEVIISTGASVVILSALLMSSISLQRSLFNNERSAGLYSDQRRLTDYLSRDLRRAVSIAVTDEKGNRREVQAEAAEVNINERASLLLELPGYYRSNLKYDEAYEQSLDVVGDVDRLDYGDASGLAPTVEVSFRKVYVGREKTVCYVRQEAGVDETISREAGNLLVQVSIAAGGQVATLRTSYRTTPQLNARVITTFDRVLLRNPPLAYRP